MRVKTILLVEDNESDVALTRRALAKGRIDNPLIVAEDGQEALDYLFGTGPHTGRDLSEQPALILLDLKVPVVDGLTVLRLIRASSATRRLPVVVLTTSLEAQDLTTAYDEGVNSYLRKPIDFEQFASTIASATHYWLALNEPAPPA